MKRLVILILLFFSVTFSGFSQDKISGKVRKEEMADKMRSNGKIYAVVAVVFIINLGLLGYTIAIDRKISRLEKRLEKDQED